MKPVDAHLDFVFDLDGYGGTGVAAPLVFPALGPPSPPSPPSPPPGAEAVWGMSVSAALGRAPNWTYHSDSFEWRGDSHSHLGWAIPSTWTALLFVLVLGRRSLT